MVPCHENTDRATVDAAKYPRPCFRHNLQFPNQSVVREIARNQHGINILFRKEPECLFEHVDSLLATKHIRWTHMDVTQYPDLEVRRANCGLRPCRRTRKGECASNKLPSVHRFNPPSRSISFANLRRCSFMGSGRTVKRVNDSDTDSGTFKSGFLGSSLERIAKYS